MGTHSLDIEDYNGVVRPIVSLDRYINESIPIVMSDHEKGGTLAAEELLRCGCKKVLQIMGSRNVNTPAHLHHYAFEKKHSGGRCHGVYRRSAMEQVEL